jgi:hypothetical protein
MYGYVSFQSLKQATRGKDEAELGQTSHVAFLHRFSKQPLTCGKRKHRGGSSQFCNNMRSVAMNVLERDSGHKVCKKTGPALRALHQTQVRMYGILQPT